MPELDFAVAGVEIERFAAVPTLMFDLDVRTRDRPVRNLALHTQVRIEPARRAYEAREEEPLSELFGDRPRWNQTLKGFLWHHVDLQAPGFERERRLKLPLTCSYDFNVAATKYFFGLSGGSAPLSFLFSGAVFYDDDQGRLQISQIAWSKDARFVLPVETWRGLMAQYYPDTTWLRVRNDLFERLYRYKREGGYTDWDAALDSLLSHVGAPEVRQ